MFNDKRIDKLQSVLVSMVILLAFFNPVLIASAAGSEDISIGSATLNPGDTVVLPITLADVTNITGVDVTVVYDTNIVTIQNVAANSSVTGSSVFPNIDNEVGKTTIAFTNTNYVTATSTVPIIDITFEVVGSSGSSILELQEVELSDALFNVFVPSTINNGEIVIASAPTVTIHSPPNITNDSTPQLYATFDQIATSTWYVLDGAAGTWGSNTDNLTVILPELSEGQHTIKVYANNSNGKIGNASQDFLVDTIAPVVMIDTVTSPTNINSQIITGTMENGVTVEVTCPTATVSTTTYPTDTTWSVDLTDMGEGDNVITTTATDQAGNTASDTATIAVDSLTSITIDEVTSPTNINSQTVTGTMENGATVGVTCPTATVGVVTYPTDTTWSVDLTDMGEGENVITATATDQTGNTALDTATIVLDSVTTITIDDVTSPTNLDYQTVTGTMENSATVGVTCSTATAGAVTYPTDTTWSVDLTDMGEGENVITATATDQAGNIASDTATIAVDSLTTITIDEVTSPTNINSQTVTGTMENGATVGVTCPTTTVGTATYPTDTTWSVEITGMTEGDNVIIATATDQAGNTASDTATIAVDTVTTITIDGVTSPTNLDNQTVTGTMENGATVGVTCPTATVGAVTNPTDTTWSVEITGMTEGDNVITATASDQTGNTASDTATIALDTTLPTITIDDVTSPTNLDYQTVTGTMENGATVGVTCLTATVGAVTNPTDTTWSVEITGMTEGDNVITATATDQIGNTASDTATIVLDSVTTLTIDDVTTPTNLDYQTVTGTKESGATVKVTCSTATVGTVTYPTGTTWSVEITGMTEGDNVITATATDQTGNTASDTTTIIVDSVTTTTIDDITTPTNLYYQTVTGIKESGATVGVTCSTATVGTVTTTDTIWSVEITGMTEGDNVITATATDQLGNTASDTATIIVDSVTTITIDDITTPTNLDYQTVTGTMENDATVEVTCPTTTVGTVTYPTGTTWSVEITGMTEGDNLITATATDQLSNTASDTVTIVLDTTLPTITIDSVTSPTNLDYQTVTGTMENGAEVEVTCPMATVGTLTVTDTTWSVEITDMTDGDNVITATATDSFEYTASDTATVVLDITLPSIISVTLNDTVVQTGALIEVNVSATDENGIASVTADGTLLTLTEGYYVGTITAGTSPVTVNVTDEAGNLATDTSAYIIDDVEPTINSVTLNDTVVRTGAPIEVNVSATDENGIVSVTADGTLLTLIEGYYVGIITAGTSPVTVNVTDEAGNLATDTSAYIIDDVEPTINSVTLNDTVVRTDVPIEVNVSATDENGIVSVTADGTPLPLIEGYYVGIIIAGTSPVTVIVTDEAGNLATDTSAYIIDDTEPKVNITEPLQNTIRFVDNIIRGEVKDDNFASATLTVKSETDVIVSQYNLSILNNSFSERVEFAPGQNNTLELSAIDEAGNLNSSTIIVTVENNTIQEVYNVNDSAPVNIDAMNETDTKIEFYSNVNKSVTFTVTAITDQDDIDKLNNNSAFGEIALGKIVEINVTGLDATNESEVQYVLVNLYYTIYDLDLDGDGTVEPGELDEDNLFIYWYNESGNWTKLLENNPDWVIDNGQMKIAGDNPGHVWVKVKHLSMFGLVASAEPELTEDDDDEDTNGGSGGSSSSGGGASGELHENIACSETDRQYVYANSDISYSFEQEGNVVKFVKFTSLKSAGQVATKVEILNDTSTLVDNPPSDIVYKNLNIWVGNAGWGTERNIDDATVVFTVEKSWITANNIDESSIALYRYSDDTWHELVTRKIAEDANCLQFEAETPGFSPFAVTGKEFAGEPGEEGIVPEPTVTAEKTPTPTDDDGIPGFSLFAGLSILLIAVQLLRKKN